MYCPNCRSEVAAEGGYCTLCGTAISTQLCPNGHVMDPSWTHCHVCAGGLGGNTGKGRTVIEESSQAPYTPQGGFTKGATLVEGPPPITPDMMGSGKGRTLVEGPRQKAKTLFDPGVVPEGAVDAPGSATHPRLPRLVGWLVSFSPDPSGTDFKVREGRNVIGAETECEIVIGQDPAISGKHAVLIFRDGQAQIRDNDSQNGTYVNGQDIFGKGAVPLVDGDTIKLGATELELYLLRQRS